MPWTTAKERAIIMAADTAAIQGYKIARELPSITMEEGSNRLHPTMFRNIQPIQVASNTAPARILYGDTTERTMDTFDDGWKAAMEYAAEAPLPACAIIAVQRRSCYPLQTCGEGERAANRGNQVRSVFAPSGGLTS